MDKKDIVINAANLSELFSKQPEAAFITIWRDGNIQLGIYTGEGNKTNKIKVNSQIFKQLQPERLKSQFLAKLHIKNSGKKRFNKFGYGEKKETYNSKKDYTGIRDTESGMGEILRLEIESLVPNKVTFQNCYYWLYLVKQDENLTIEVYCSNSNNKLVRFYRDIVNGIPEKEYHFV